MKCVLVWFNTSRPLVKVFLYVLSGYVRLRVCDLVFICLFRLHLTKWRTLTRR